MGKMAVFATAGSLIIVPVLGLFLYGQAKENAMDSKKWVPRPESPTGAAGRINSPGPDRTETATFAMG